MSNTVPRGFRLAGVHCGIKRNPNKPDLTLVVSDVPAAAAGTYTQNLVFAAPVGLNRSRTPGSGFRAVVVNSGNANACTGEQGDRDARQMAAWAAAVCGAQPEQALVMSTGVIGAYLPMDKIRAGIEAAARQLAADDAALLAAARGLMTTDSTHKLCCRQQSIGSREVRIAGLAKGAAMIGPRMATMLGLILTDAPLAPATAQHLLAAAVEETFNCISVDGHMSTNDTVLLLANGAAGGEALSGTELDAFSALLGDVCGELARAIPADGEGATHLITIHVRGCADRPSARRIAKTVAESPLVKTAIAGGDPNWGRIVSAAGYAGVAFDPHKVSLHLNGTLLYRQGTPVPFDEAAVSQSIRSQRDVQIDLEFGEGQAALRFWTTDLTAEYVRLNADYRT
jgi:glutamate N-acetyltransferase/amino-acid N-acetyltransferase